MKRAAFLISGLIALSASAGFAVEEIRWGQRKQDMVQPEQPLLILRFAAPQVGLAAKKSRTVWSPPAPRTQVQLFAANYPYHIQSMTVADTHGAGPEDDLQATLVVPHGALTKDVQIRMTVSGNTLSELSVAFEPKGLVFLQPAYLKLKLGVDLVDTPLELLVAQHEFADGTVETVDLSIYQPDPQIQLAPDNALGEYVTLVIEVPGFSRYGLRSNW